MFKQIRNLALGSGLAQGLQLVALLLLSRLYAPADFGFLAKVQATASFLAVLVTLQTHLAIPLSQSPEEARRRAAATQRVCVSLSAVFLLAAVFMGKTYTLAVALSFFLGLSNTYTSFLVFGGRFSSMARFYVSRAISIVVLQIAFSYGEVQGGLTLGIVVGEGLASLYLYVVHVRPLDRLGAREVLQLLGRLKSFSCYGTLQELVSVAAFFAPLLLFAEKYGETVGGHYAMANRLVWAPVVLLSSSMAQVLYHYFGKSRPMTARAIYQPVLRYSIIVPLPLVCVAGFAAKDLLLLALGPDWELATAFFPLMLIWGLVFLISMPARVACRVHEFQSRQLMVDLFALAAILFVFFWIELTPIQSMWGLVVIGAAQNMALASWVVKGLARARRPA